MSLAERYSELKYELTKARSPKPGYEALLALHAERKTGGDPATTKRLVVQGRHEDLFLNELSIQLLKLLDEMGLRWQPRSRRYKRHR
jgi:transposase